MTLRKRLMVLGGLCALAAPSVGQELQWRPVGTAPTPAIVPTSGVAAPQAPANPAPVIVPPANPAPVIVAPATPAPVVSPPTESLIMPKPVITPAESAGISSPTPAITGQVMAVPAPGCCEICPTSATNGISWSAPSTWFSMAGPTDHRAWVRGEFLAWFTKGAGGPALLTTSNRAFPFAANPNNPPGGVVVDALQVGNIGALSDPQAVVLLSGSDLDQQFRPGVRIGAGWWFDPCGIHGIDGSIFYTPGRTETFFANTDQFPTLYRPFFAVNRGIPSLGGQPGESREIVGAAPIGLRGAIAFEQTSQFWGADLNYRRNLLQGCTTRIDGFVGFRFLRLDERLEVIEDLNYTQPVRVVSGSTVLRDIPAGLNIFVLDRFTTKNNFYGGQVGTDIEVRRDRWSFGIRPSIALGCTQQNLSVIGAYRESLNGQVTAAFPGGLYALTSNIGQRSDSVFTYVPEVQLRVGYGVTQNMRVSVGYDFLYWSSVVRPGDQIDRGLDVTRVPPPGGTPVVPPRPAALFETTDFWAQGANIGVEYRW